MDSVNELAKFIIRTICQMKKVTLSVTLERASVYFTTSATHRYNIKINKYYIERIS